MPGYTKQELREIYDRTGGYCDHCWEKLAFTNYGKHGEKGAWEVDHSVPKAKGGTDHGNNLVPAHISCNRSKQDMTTRSVRARHGVTGRPESREKRREKAAFWNEVWTVGVVAGLGWLAWKLFGKRDDNVPPSP